MSLQRAIWCLPQSPSPVSPLHPPPEWVDPFLDLSDVVLHRPASTPTPWLGRITDLLLSTSPAALGSDLSHFCRKFLLRLSPSFASSPLRSTFGPILVLPCCSSDGPANRLATRTSWSPMSSWLRFSPVPAGSGESEKVRVLVPEIRDMGHLFTIPGSNSLIKCLGSLGMVEELLWVWRRTKECGIEPGVFCYNLLIGGLVNAGFMESAVRVFEAMNGGKVPPDVVTYNTLIKGFCKEGRAKEAMEVLKEMEVKNVEPDKITYVSLIQACYSEKDFDGCLRLYQELEERKMEVPVHAYSLVIGGLCKIGKCSEGFAVFERMSGRGVR